MSNSTTAKHRLFLPLIVLVMLLTCTGCGPKYDAEYDFKYPYGFKTVTVKVDSGSRPDVYYKDECIFEYDGPVFFESLQWEVKWNSANEIELYPAAVNGRYKNERYVIKVPD